MIAPPASQTASSRVPETSPEIRTVSPEKSEDHHITILPEVIKPEEFSEKHSHKNVVPRFQISIREALAGNSPEKEESYPETGVEQEITTDTDEDIPSETDQPFDQEQLEAKWKLFAESIHAERPRMAITLRNHLPQLKPSFQVELSLENTAQKEDFQLNIKAHLQSFLRKELSNNALTVNVSVAVSGDDTKRKLYTAEEKFQYLMEKNPALTLLKQKFSLELE